MIMYVVKIKQCFVKVRVVVGVKEPDWSKNYFAK